MRNSRRPQVGQGMFDWIRSSRQRPMPEASERPRGEGYYEAPAWPPAAPRYPAEIRMPAPPPREEPGMFKWISSPKSATMSGPGNSSTGWLVGLSVAVGFGIAAALAYFSMPGQEQPPRA